ncbi:MAG: fibronectin type III domain-containing protein [Spirochaetia bacterium]|nr:fibronectin type III domain-containing protein [Spirochaetia bacterium]
MRKRILTLTGTLLLLLSAVSSGYSEQKQISLGFDDGWQHAAQFAGTRLQKGRQGFLDITLEPVQYSASAPMTDLLIHFETSQPLDVTGNYTLEREGGFSIVPDGRAGVNAGKFSSFRGGISLVPFVNTQNSANQPLFSPGMLGGSFTIEFWLSPQYLEDGETILRWSGQREHRNQVQLQSLSTTVNNRKLEWQLHNLFLQPDHQENTFVLKGRKAMVPEKWHHHMLRYQSETGVLEYLVDGVPADVTYCTEDGNPSGTIFRPYVGERSKSEIEIAPQFNGLLDELRITRSFVEAPTLHGLSSAGGYTTIGPLDFGEAESTLLSIDVEYEEPGDSKSFFYYRIDTQQEWIPFQPGESLQPAPTARYLELKFQLYPDGIGSQSPKVSSAAIDYRPNLPPPPPTGLTARPAHGAIELSWNPIQQTDLAGYIVYYGTSSGIYRSSDSNAGASPIDVGARTSLSLEGLQNGTLYYIAVAAYDTAGRQHRSSLSHEVSARPSDFYGD